MSHSLAHRQRWHKILLFLMVMGGLLKSGCANVTLPPIFGDHMVLQQGMSLPVWGEADPGEKVTVAFIGQSVTTQANAQGIWRVNLQPAYLRSAPDVLIVEGKNRLEFSDVLVGDVWLCGGQSNMAFPLIKSYRGELELLHSDDPELRFFVVKTAAALRPQKTLTGEWQRCTSMTAGSFSAVGYFFGRDLRKTTGLPIGLIGSYVPATPIQSWMSLKSLQEAPSFSHYLADYATMSRELSNTKISYAQRQKEYEDHLTHWQETVGVMYEKMLTAWRMQCEVARSKLFAQPLKPEPPIFPPQPPLPPDGGKQFPTSFFNGMIFPLIPYAITGVIWYQGSSNQGSSAFEYRRLFPRLIRSWRAAWGEGPFPFYFVSLAAHYKTSPEPVELMMDEEGTFNPAWPWLREGQAAALALPQTGMVVATDLGDPDDIHPADKLDIGRRLAFLARKNIYGEKIVESGPVYQSMKQEGNKIKLTFSSIGRGLTIGAPPWSYDDVIPFSCELKGFAIAGRDRHWKEGKAFIEGNNILVFNEHISHPEAVRYNWKNNPLGNLYNKEGLPAAPFRTDTDQPQ